MGIHLLRVVLAVLFLGASAMAAPTVVIDAGHGGHDRGGGPGQRIPEKGYALDVALRLSRVLQASGYRTVLTRSTDVFIPLGKRCQIGNSNRGAVFVSIHFNSASRSGASGIETYSYGSRSGAALAASIHREVVRSTGGVDRGVRQRRYYVLRNSKIPAALAELGFLTNPSEASRIMSSSYRQKLAEAVARGIMSRHR